MLKPFRIFAGLLLTGLLLYAASQAAGDCKTGLHLHDNCMWLWLREQLPLPASKLLRAAVLELVGLVLLAGLYLTGRYVFPPWTREESSPHNAQQETLPNSDSPRRTATTPHNGL